MTYQKWSLTSFPIPTEESQAALARHLAGFFMIWLLTISLVSYLTTYLLCTLCTILTMLNYLHFMPHTMLFLLTEMTSPNPFLWVTPTYLSWFISGVSKSLSLTALIGWLPLQLTVLKTHSVLISNMLVFAVYYHLFVLFPLIQMWTSKSQGLCQIRVCVLAHSRYSNIFCSINWGMQGDYHISLRITNLHVDCGYHLQESGPNPFWGAHIRVWELKLFNPTICNRMILFFSDSHSTLLFHHIVVGIISLSMNSSQSCHVSCFSFVICNPGSLLRLRVSSEDTNDEFHSMWLPPLIPGASDSSLVSNKIPLLTSLRPNPRKVLWFKFFLLFVVESP